MTTFLVVRKDDLDAKDLNAFLHELYEKHYSLPLLVNDNGSIRYREIAPKRILVSFAYGATLVDLDTFRPDHNIPINNCRDRACAKDYWSRTSARKRAEGRRVKYPEGLDFETYVRLLHLLSSYCGEYGHSALVFHEFEDRWELMSENSDPREDDSDVFDSDSDI